jgi:hypothetical protein
MGQVGRVGRMGPVGRVGLVGKTLAFALACMTVACGAKAVEHGEASPEALAREVLQAIGAHDAGRLRQLAITEQEFREIVWPDLPAAEPRTNLTVEYVWQDLHQKSDADLRQTLEIHGDRPLEFVSVSFRGETSQYRHYLVHRDARVTVRDAEGAEETVRLFGSVFEQDGRYKVFSYVTD